MGHETNETDAIYRGERFVVQCHHLNDATTDGDSLNKDFLLVAKSNSIRGFWSVCSLVFGSQVSQKTQIQRNSKQVQMHDMLVANLNSVVKKHVTDRRTDRPTDPNIESLVRD